MSRGHKLPDMADRCRICLVDQGCMTSLRDEDLKSKLKDLTKCTYIDVSTAGTLSFGYIKGVAISRFFGVFISFSSFDIDQI